MPAPNQTEDNVRRLVSQGLARSTDGAIIPGPFVISAKTTNYTIGLSDASGTMFTNRGAAGTVTFTLPGPTAVPAGTYYLFAGVADQTITVAPPTADTSITLNDAASDSLSASTAMQKIGSIMIAFTDGTAWFQAGLAVGATYTAAT